MRVNKYADKFFMSLFNKTLQLLCVITKRPNSAQDLRRQCTSSMCEQSLCKVLIQRNEISLNYTQINNVSTPKVV